jgi:hypothetical protein
VGEQRGTAGDSGEQRETVGNCGELRETAGNCGRLRRTAGDCGELRETAGNCGELRGTAGNCGELREMEESHDVIFPPNHAFPYLSILPILPPFRQGCKKPLFYIFKISVTIFRYRLHFLVSRSGWSRAGLGLVSGWSRAGLGLVSGWSRANRIWTVR